MEVSTAIWIPLLHLLGVTAGPLLPLHFITPKRSAASIDCLADARYTVGPGANERRVEV